MKWKETSIVSVDPPTVCLTFVIDISFSSPLESADIYSVINMVVDINYT